MIKSERLFQIKSMRYCFFQQDLSLRNIGKTKENRLLFSRPIKSANYYLKTSESSVSQSVTILLSLNLYTLSLHSLATDLDNGIANLSI